MSRFMEFDCGPRHRTVTRSRRFPWAQMLLTVLTGAALGLVLLASLGILTPAHAGELHQTTELQRAAERLNDTCRDDPKAVGACAARDGVMAQLKTQGYCWNAKAPTPATLWQVCSVADDATARRVAGLKVTPCDASGDIAYSLAMMRDAGLSPQLAYRNAVAQAVRGQLDPAPLESMTWKVYAELGAVQPAAIRHAVRYNCRRASGLL